MADAEDEEYGERATRGRRRVTTRESKDVAKPRPKGRQRLPRVIKPKAANEVYADEELHCICKQPYDPKRYMIGCDSCNGWYHARCVNVTVANAQKLREYVCPPCKNKEMAEREKEGAVPLESSAGKRAGSSGSGSSNRGKKRKAEENKRQYDRPQVSMQRRLAKTQHLKRIKTKRVEDTLVTYTVDEEDLSQESDDDEPIYLTSDDSDGELTTEQLQDRALKEARLLRLDQAPQTGIRRFLYKYTYMLEAPPSVASAATAVGPPMPAFGVVFQPGLSGAPSTTTGPAAAAVMTPSTFLVNPSDGSTSAATSTCLPGPLAATLSPTRASTSASASASAGDASGNSALPVTAYLDNRSAVFPANRTRARRPLFRVPPRLLAIDVEALAAENDDFGMAMLAQWERTGARFTPEQRDRELLMHMRTKRAEIDCGFMELEKQKRRLEAGSAYALRQTLLANLNQPMPAAKESPIFRGLESLRPPAHHKIERQHTGLPPPPTLLAWGEVLLCRGCFGHIPAEFFNEHVEQCADQATLNHPSSFRTATGFRAPPPLATVCGFPLEGKTGSYCSQPRADCKDHAGWEEIWRITYEHRAYLLNRRMQLIDNEIETVLARIQEREAAAKLTVEELAAAEQSTQASLQQAYEALPPRAEAVLAAIDAEASARQAAAAAAYMATAEAKTAAVSIEGEGEAAETAPVKAEGMDTSAV